MDSLMHSDKHIRAAAGDELQAITQEYYGYHALAPRRDRERVRRKYQEWWTSKGRARFQKQPEAATHPKE